MIRIWVSTMDRSFRSFYVDLTAPQYLHLLVQNLERHGIATFDKINTNEQFISLAESIGTVFTHTTADSRGITRIVPNKEYIEKPGYRGFTQSELAFHTDRSGFPKPPTLLMLYCAKPASEGGDSIFVDGKDIYEYLAQRYPDILEQLLAPESAIFGGAELPFIGSVFTKLPNGYVMVRFRSDHFGYFSAPLIKSLPIFFKIIDDRSFSFNLGKNEGYIIHNGRVLHGRTHFHGEEREMYRILVDIDTESSIGARIQLGFLPDSD